MFLWNALNQNCAVLMELYGEFCMFDAILRVQAHANRTIYTRY